MIWNVHLIKKYIKAKYQNVLKNQFQKIIFDVINLLKKANSNENLI